VTAFATRSVLGRFAKTPSPPLRHTLKIYEVKNPKVKNRKVQNQKGMSIMSDNPTSGSAAEPNAGATSQPQKAPTRHGLTILQWLAVAAVAGIVLTVVLNLLR
jgi:hypothetical protein